MKLIWSPQAEADLADAFDFIARDDIGAAISVEDRILAAVEGLRDYPRAGRLSERGDFREQAVPSTPYLVIYSPGDEVIESLRIWHGRRRPFALG